MQLRYNSDAHSRFQYKSPIISNSLKIGNYFSTEVKFILHQNHKFGDGSLTGYLWFLWYLGHRAES